MKKTYSITLDDAVWQRLEDMARERGAVYHGRLSRAAVIEQLVAAAQQPAESVPAPVRTPPPAAPQQWRLSDVIALLPDKLQAQWARDGARCEWWVKQMLGAINSAPRE